MLGEQSPASLHSLLGPSHGRRLGWVPLPRPWPREVTQPRAGDRRLSGQDQRAGRKKSSDCSLCPGLAPGPLFWDSPSPGCVTTGACIEGCFLRLRGRPWGCRATKEGGLAAWQRSFARLFHPQRANLVGEIKGILSGQAVLQLCLARSAWPLATPLHPGRARAPGLPPLCGSFLFCLWPSGGRGRACPVSSICGDARSRLGFGSAQAGHLLSQCVCLGGLGAAFPRAALAGVGSCPEEPLQGWGAHGVLG